ncbi:MAG: MBL fold metallo-hydrolase [bacterium]|nr:MBL fold metallo-hydrolase [bacterium]
MFFERIYEKGLAQASYIVGCQATKEAIVIDPKRDIDTYFEIAERENLRITHIAETHIHADFLSGSLELAHETGAKIYLSNEGGNDWQYQFDHIGLKDGDIIKIGNINLEVMHTPGHTPEHISFILTDLPASKEPSMIFTGDFVFVGDVGRPDLLEKAAGYEGTMIAGARQMFQSLKRFKELPDHLQVWPAHGAGSACGKSLGAVPSSTIGYEKLSNWALKINDEETFIRTLLDGQPEPPKYFAMMKKLNKIGPRVLGSVPHPARLSVARFKDSIQNNYQIVDTRDKLSFAGGHILGSLNIQDNNSFSTWAGWMLEYDRPIILIARERRVDALNRALIRIGIDNLEGYISDIDKLESSGMDIEILNQISVNELNQDISKYKVIDVRSYTEYDISSIPESVNIHAGQLEKNLDKISKEEELVVYCASGDRSAIAASFLLKKGFSKVYNLSGGINSWFQAGYKINRGTIKESEPANII